MNRSVWLRVCTTVALPFIVGAAAPVHAETLDEDASFSLKLSKALRERTFMRAGVIYVNVKTSSGDAYDVTGPVIRKEDLVNAAPNSGLPGAIVGNSPKAHMVTAGQNLDMAMDRLGITEMGTPAGVRARSADAIGTAGISIGHWLTDDFTWLLEAYVLAAPIKSKIYGDGVNGTGGASYINGKHILDTKLLPPTVMFGRYWGDKDAKFRPYTGVMAMYAIFFDSKVTQTLNNYMGGASPGDSTVSLKNAFGIGPAIGFKYDINDSWHVSLNVGSTKLKTQATLTTRNTTITSNSPILKDYQYDIVSTIETTASGFDNNPTFSTYYRNAGGAVTAFMKGLATARGSDNLGTYVRKQETALTSTLMMLSVGRSF